LLRIFFKSVAKNSVRPSKGMAEGGCGGNSAMPLQKIEASPAALLVKAKHHRKILFSLGEKEIRRAQKIIFNRAPRFSPRPHPRRCGARVTYS